MKLSFLSFLVGTAVAGPLGSYRVFEQLSEAPEPWTLKSGTEVDRDQSLKLWIHLKNRNIESFHQKVYDVSTPDHPDYGRHLSRVELRDMLAPSQRSYDMVATWLKEHGLSDKATIENDWIIIDGTIGDAAELLQAEYQVFESKADGKTTARTLAYSLPNALHDHVDMVAPTIKFSTTSAMRSTIVKNYPAPAVIKSSSGNIHNGLDKVACNNSITPDCLKALYNFKDFRASRRNGNEFLLAGFLEEYAQHNDLAQFLSAYAPNANGSDFSTILINNGSNLQVNVSGPQNHGEAKLDIQYGLSLAYPTPTFYSSTAGRPPETTTTEVDNEPYLQFLTYLLTLETIPQTISISYGDAEPTVPFSYATTVCNLFAQVAARGASVFVSSGDDGSGGNCAVGNSTKLQYGSEFPGGCPFVTAVGATVQVAPEVAVDFSGGGFSNYFARPAYQDAAVNTWLTNYSDPAFTKYFNASGRAYPDVSAQGVNFITIEDGAVVPESGTSASCPAFAAVVALLNSDRISNGLPPFGLLNPWLYSKAADAKAFNDIVAGKSVGCTSQIPGAGFAATVGWDPVTGLGTPDFKKLRLVSTGLS
ncbi:subtilisin-like protein [Stipitochalara longipes BDJ]|nr:subtilisin-like protein [Stipitochalara longipes BDJ]